MTSKPPASPTRRPGETQAGKPARPGPHIPFAVRAVSGRSRNRHDSDGGEYLDHCPTQRPWRGPQHGIPTAPDEPANPGTLAWLVPATERPVPERPRLGQTTAVGRPDWADRAPAAEVSRRPRTERTARYCAVCAVCRGDNAPADGRIRRREDS
jgi:hypothetical protein